MMLVFPIRISDLPLLLLQKELLGSWPSLPETWEEAGDRLLNAAQEIMLLASGKNVLLVTHAEARHLRIVQVQASPSKRCACRLFCKSLAG